MNKQAFFFGIAYTVAVISFKLIVLLGGYSLTHFGWYYSHITTVFLILPFYAMAIYGVRRENNGVIAGREAMRLALTVFAIGAVLTGVYNYAEFELSGKKMAIDYYNSPQFLEFLKTKTKVKPADFEKIIAEQIQNSEVSSFKATTGKLFSLMLIGLSGAFIVASVMKRRPSSL